MSDRHQVSPYPVRMPGELREKLQDSANQRKRSLNAEIVDRLEKSLEGDNDSSNRENGPGFGSDSDHQLHLWMESLAKEVRQLKMDFRKQGNKDE